MAFVHFVVKPSAGRSSVPANISVHDTRVSNVVTPTACLWVDITFKVIHNVHIMKTATIRQVRNTFPEILAWIEKGEEVMVLNRKTPVARICPLKPDIQETVDMPDFSSRSKKILNGRSLSIGEHLQNERDESRW